MSKDFKGIDWGKGRIDLSNHISILEMKPIEIHHKADGQLGDNPSFVIVMDRYYGPDHQSVWSNIATDAE